MNTLLRLAQVGLIAFTTTIAQAGPMGYSVNSDAVDGDTLHAIDLDSGTATAALAGPVRSLGVKRSDIEGLAFDSLGVLWGVDDDSQNLFPIDTTSGQVLHTKEVSLSGLAGSVGNDFGMTFTCDGELLVSTIGDQSLYRLQLDGTATKIGDLGADISAIAAIGKPAKLYGLGNGVIRSGDVIVPGNPNLYSIDPESGAATMIGPLGAAVSDYFEAGLSFDAEGRLWAITDRKTVDENLGSEVLLLNPETGQATVQSTTEETAFESLAVAPPALCQGEVPSEPGAEHPRIPTLDQYGRLLAILALMLAGFVALRRDRKA